LRRRLRKTPLLARLHREIIERKEFNYYNIAHVPVSRAITTISSREESEARASLEAKQVARCKGVRREKKERKEEEERKKEKKKRKEKKSFPPGAFELSFSPPLAVTRARMVDARSWRWRKENLVNPW